MVPGLDTVGPLPIPYARIRGRARRVYGSDHRRWADLAGQTMGDLLKHRGAGIRTLEQLIAAAREDVDTCPVAMSRPPLPAPVAVEELLARLDVRDRVLLSMRVWAHAGAGHLRNRPHRTAHRLLPGGLSC